MREISSLKNAAQPRGIIVFGANGCGKTTLARELARLLGFLHMDIEDYHFIKSAIPYTAQRTREERLELMLCDIRRHGSFVLSAVAGDVGAQAEALFALGVFLTAPAGLRAQRIQQRELARHGGRILPGGDMYEQHRSFAAFAASRPMQPIEAWAKTLACPVIHADGARDWRALAADIARQFCEAGL